ncbi:MAG: hypothetical protein WB698_01620 [Solirubrobacteraceae bacterium]
MELQMQRPPVSRSRQREREPRRPATGTVWVRLRRIALLACLFALVPAVISYAGMALETSNTSLAVRSVEWLRSNGGAGLVSKIENIYYSLTAPSKGGPGLKSLPHVGVSVTQTHAAHHPYQPSRIQPLASPALPGEGIWHATRPGVPYPPVLVSTFRSDPAEYPRLVAGLAWIDPHRTTITLYPGREQPSVELPTRGPMEVPPALRSGLLATFNSAFKLEDSKGGFAYHGHTYAPMQNGQATFIEREGGGVNIESWSASATAPSDVVFARQNLPLIVTGGRPNPLLNDSAEWGATLGNAVQVWRSGIGIDRHGDLIYAQANYQTVASLARILIHAGAIRAMELDINSYWVSFNSYGAPGGRQPTKLLAETERPASRYLEPDDRDFFAVFEK